MDRELRVAQCRRTHLRLGNVRLVLALAAAGIAWASFKQHAFSPWSITLPAVAFIGIAAYHSPIIRARDLAQRAVAFYQSGLARIENLWPGTGQTGERFSDPHHVYAADLDLFGRASLFELLSTGRTRIGEETPLATPRPCHSEAPPAAEESGFGLWPAPVRARRLRMTPLHVGASIRVNDSWQEGSSRFYAEIIRLRRLFDLAGAGPQLLFLLDELLQGTNSKDRRIGAEGVLSALLSRGAIGLVTTHALALAEIGGSLNGYLHNVHFQEEFENGRISFDYKLREGVVTKSNGLALMRSIGLDV